MADVVARDEPFVYKVAVDRVVGPEPSFGEVARPEPCGAEPSGSGLLSIDRSVLDQVPLERLEDQLTSFAGHLAAATARWLVWLSAYDRRAGWEASGCRSLAHWLSWKCSMSPRTAREHVSVARSLDQLPVVRCRFLDGELSYSKVRALCRVATVDSEAELVRFALIATASQLERTVAGLRRVAAGMDEDESAAAAHRLRSWQSEDLGDGSVEMRLRVPVDVARRVIESVATKTDAEVDVLVAGSGRSRREIVAERDGLGALRADTAVGLLTGELDRVDASIVDVQVVVDADTLILGCSAPPDSSEAPDHPASVSGIGGTASDGSGGEWRSEVAGARIAPSVARRLACDGRLLPVIEDNAGRTKMIGRQTRAIPVPVRRAVHHRDQGMCRFPGCGQTRRLHVHHAVHRADGGANTADNLLLVCSFHHHLLHEGRWQASVDPTGGTGHVFADQDERHATTKRFRGAAEDIVRHRHINPRTIEPTWAGEPYDHAYVVDTLIQLLSDDAPQTDRPGRRRTPPGGGGHL